MYYFKRKKEKTNLFLSILKSSLVLFLSIYYCATLSGQFFEFDYAAGQLQQYEIPSGVTSIRIEVVGADGGGRFENRYSNSFLNGGQGATATGTFPVNPGDVLELFLGAAGANEKLEIPENGTAVVKTAAGGGDASAVFLNNNSNPLLIAGGGGGSGGTAAGFGGENTTTGGFPSSGAGGVTGGAGGLGGQWISFNSVIWGFGDAFGGGGGGGYLSAGATGLDNFIITNLPSAGPGIGGEKLKGGTGGTGVDAGWGGGGGGGGYSGGSGSNGNGSGDISNSIANPVAGGGGGSYVSDLAVNPTINAGGHGGGNGNNGYINIILNPNTPPVAVCKNVTINANSNCEAVLSASAFDGGSTDPDDNDLSFSVLPAGPYPQGTTMVTLTVNDGLASDNCTAEVTVVDNMPPTALCQDVTVQLDANGIANVTTMQINNESFDNCSGINVSPSVSPNTFNCTHVGQQTVTLTVNDASQNTAACTATVTVEDNIPPTAVCQDITVQIDATGEANFTAGQVDNGSSDNCGFLAFNTSPLSYDCSDVGDKTHTLFVTDASNNFSTCTATVTVVDNIQPTALCQDITVQLDDGGNGSFTSGDIDAGSSDNCEISSIFLDPAVDTDFDCTDVGTKMFMLYVNDVNGNESNCNAMVTVEDHIDPNALCITSGTFYIGPDGTLILTGEEVNNGSTDNCDIDSYSVPDNSYDTDDINILQSLELTVTDVNGNSANCNSTFTIIKRPSVVQFLGESSVQYSDEVSLSAFVSDGLLSGTPAQGGGTVTFQIGTQTATATVDANGIAQTTLVITQEPSLGCSTDPTNTYVVDISFSGNSIYEPSTDHENPFTIEQEDARVTYTGTMFAFTSNNSNTADVLLSATIQDISQTAEAAGDMDAGEISNAEVFFYLYDDGTRTPINTVGIPVSLIDPSDPTTGTALLEWESEALGNNEDSKSFMIGVEVCGYYSRNNSVDYTVVTISRPEDNFVTGGGYLILEAPAGIIAGDIGSRNNFGFNIRYNNSGTNVKGSINTIIRRTEPDGLHTYQIKGNQMNSLAVDAETGFAEFFGKANVKDITDPDNPISVFGNGIFQVKMTDDVEPDDEDVISFTFWDNDGTLRYSSNWTGTTSLQQLLDGGNLSVNARGNGNGRFLTDSESMPLEHNNKSKLEHAPISLTAFPNPFDKRSVIRFDLPETSQVTLNMYNLKGQLVDQLFRGEISAGVHQQEWDGTDEQGTRLPDGIYILQLRTEQEVVNHRLLIHRIKAR